MQIYSLYHLRDALKNIDELISVIEELKYTDEVRDWQRTLNILRGEFQSRLRFSELQALQNTRRRTTQ